MLFRSARSPRLRAGCFAAFLTVFLTVFFAGFAADFFVTFFAGFVAALLTGFASLFRALGAVAGDCAFGRAALLRGFDAVLGSAASSGMSTIPSCFFRFAIATPSPILRHTSLWRKGAVFTSPKGQHFVTREGTRFARVPSLCLNGINPRSLQDAWPDEPFCGSRRSYE